jgi:hypothetical protein
MRGGREVSAGAPKAEPPKPLEGRAGEPPFGGSLPQLAAEAGNVVGNHPSPMTKWFVLKASGVPLSMKTSHRAWGNWLYASRFTSRARCDSQIIVALKVLRHRAFTSSPLSGRVVDLLFIATKNYIVIILILMLKNQKIEIRKEQ